MVKKYSKSRKGHKGRKGRITRGGGYSFGAAVADGAPYASEVIGGPKLTPDCLEATRSGLATASPGGLPGFAGGGMNLNLGEPGAPVLKGGRYTADVGAGPLTDAAGPGFAGYPIISRIGCEGGLVNTSPPGALPNPTPLQNGGVGGVDSAFYTAPTAGYSNGPSTFVDSVGAPVLLQQPYDARIMNPACLKTGGARKSKRTNKKSRKSRKSRKSNRKSRK